MELLIIRHGDAALLPMEGGGPPLSEAGVQAILRLKGLLVGQQLKCQALFSSPLKRALQTAELLQGIWDLPVQTVDWLCPGIEPSRILKELKASAVTAPLLVGHLPTLGWLLSALVWGSPPREVGLPKGSATCLEVKAWEPSGAKLLWMLNADLKDLNPS